MVSPALNLARGTTALVTGSARGIGKAIALRLARDGYNVAVNDLAVNKDGAAETVKEIQQLGREAVSIEADVSKEADAQRLIETTASKLGSLDTLVNNAGIAHIKPLLETTEADRRRVLDVNVHGVMTTAIAAANQMIKQGNGGRIINAASIVAFKPFAVLTPYSASKWAVRGFTQGAAMEWARYGIRVNGYAPGIVDTSMWEAIDKSLAHMRGAQEGDVRQQYVEELTTLQRVSVPEDIAKLVSFLASADSEFMTGQTVICDGGIQFS